MAVYTMKSDKIFLRCLDVGAIQVYELDSPYIFPVKGKNWSHLGISIGPGKQFESLKIGDKEISGADVQILMKDLFNSRLLVNREGLGFLATGGVTYVVLEVEYYRMFDLFDWSKYQVNTSLNTKWARSNFMDGRPLDILGNNQGSGNRDDDEYKKKLLEKEKELENEKLKHKEELEEVKRKKEVERRKTQEKIEKLIEDLAEASRQKEEELKDKQQEINRLKEESVEAERKKNEEIAKLKVDIGKLKVALGKAEGKKKHENNEVALEKKKVKELEEELKLHVFLRSGLRDSNAFFGKLMQYMLTSIPSSKLNVIPINDQGVQYIKFEQLFEVVNAVMPIGPILDSVSEFPTQKLYRKESFYGDFDLNNWKVVRVATHIKGTLAFYDGNKYYKGVLNTDIGIYQYPIPCRAEHLCNFTTRHNRHAVYNIMGVGLRFAIECFNAEGNVFLYS